MRHFVMISRETDDDETDSPAPVFGTSILPRDGTLAVDSSE